MICLIIEHVLYLNSSLYTTLIIVTNETSNIYITYCVSIAVGNIIFLLYKI